MLGLKDLHNFHRQAGQVGLPSGSCSSLLQLHAVTGELLSDPGTLVAEVIMIMIVIMYFVYETHGSWATCSALYWGKADWGWIVLAVPCLSRLLIRY